MTFPPTQNFTRRSSATEAPEPPTDHALLFRRLSQLRRTQLHPRHRRSARRLIIAFELLLVLAVAAILIAALSLRQAMQTSLPQLDGSLAIAGLSAPVTVTRDLQGVPSIHAANLDDLLFSQGFITASDRLWQMDALRRHAAGELAEILGPSLVDHDRRQRYLQIRAAADRAVAVLPPDQLHQLDAYARGVNAFIESHRNNLPVEFHLLHYTPAPWSPRDSLLVALAMTEDLSTEFPQKLNREELSAFLPDNLLPDLYPVGSWRDRPPSRPAPDLTTPQQEIEQIPLDKSQSLNHPYQPAGPSTHQQTGCPMSALSNMGSQNAGCATSLALRNMGSQNASTSTRAFASPQPLLATFAALNANLCNGCRSGSNNWVVAGSHSASGAPLLSNDMHLSLNVPDIWYEASLHAAGVTPLDVEGFTLPGIPFVIAGRNASVAWGFTNTGADVQDLRIEHLRGSGLNTEFELPNGSWSLATHQTEHIRVRGGRDVTLDVLTTTHSLGDTSIQTPIISPLLSPAHSGDHRVLSLAWPIYDPVTVSVPLFSINTASDAAGLVAAFAAFSNVSQNLVYADAHHIGYHMLGRIPIRGPAIQRPRTVQPFVMPNRTPEEDEEDESGSPQATLQTPSLVLASTTTNLLSQREPRRSVADAPRELPSRRESRSHIARRSGETRSSHLARAATPQTEDQQLPTAPTTAYTIGSPISPVPVDALDPNQVWSGYIPYNDLPSTLDPPSGVIATANARVAPDDYPYFLANNWTDSYRVERIYHLLEAGPTLTPADMLRIQTDVHSEFDLVLAQRLAYALDHASPALLAHDPRRLHQAADLLRKWNGDLTPGSSAAAIVASTHDRLWPMLLTPQIRSQIQQQLRAHPHNSTPSPDDLAALYTWAEKDSALEALLEHTPARWLPPGFANWDDLLTVVVAQALRQSGAPSNLATWRYGAIHSVEIAHPIFGSHGFLSRLLGLPTGTGLQPNGGDNTTIDATGLHFGPSERFTADLAGATTANLPTGESGNPKSPWYLDQFFPWLRGTTFPLPLDHPTATHTLVLTPK
jgi:penicillin amidase